MTNEVGGAAGNRKGMNENRIHRDRRGWREAVHEVIFEADTPAGKTFDVALIVCIATSVILVMLESVNSVREAYGGILYAAEWCFTVLFTIEYILRLSCIGRPLSYATSFFGIVDLLAILPTYLDLVLPGSHYLLVIRVLRVLRVFRVFKLVKYVRESNTLVRALRASRRKIVVFFSTVLTLVVVLGSLMYVVEGEEHGFTSIPRSIYWAIVTVTTVGYGDILPKTHVGQALAALAMILGYSIIAVPTGIVTVEMSQAFAKEVSTQSCPECSAEGHDSDAAHCKYCGAKL
jgi:voltage-gated potassium channel